MATRHMNDTLTNSMNKMKKVYCLFYWHRGSLAFVVAHFSVLWCQYTRVCVYDCISLCIKNWNNQCGKHVSKSISDILPNKKEETYCGNNGKNTRKKHVYDWLTKCLCFVIFVIRNSIRSNHIFFSFTIYLLQQCVPSHFQRQWWGKRSSNKQ